MSEVITRQEGDVLVLTIDNPPVNAAGMAVRIALLEAIKNADSDSSVYAIILIGAGKTFVAGADIREFGKKLEGPDGRAAFDAIESSQKPCITALHGNALGAGLELAMATNYRVALRSAKMGLPEANIGLLPGAGGTQRLPRLVGPEVALDLISSGKHFGAEKALQYGVIDAIVDGETYDDLLAGALAFARTVIDEQRPLKRVRDLDEKITDVDLSLFENFSKKMAHKWVGLINQPYIVDCVKAACTMSWDDGYALEKKLFEECKASPQREALSYIFFAERQAAKIPDVPKEIKPQVVNSVAIIGAGTMGGGIAMCFANSGIPVTQVEMSQEALDRGRGIIEKNYATSVSRGSMSQANADKAMSLITGTVSYDDIADCDMVIEAVFEDMDIKKQVFTKLDAVMKPGAVLATNTSTLDIDQIASATKRPEAVVGTHFFSPANVMKLLEAVRGAKSSPQTLATAMGLAKKINKVAVLAGNCDGFIGNRILAAYGRQAEFLLEENCMPWDVDNALKEFGLPMGMFLMRDMAGLDVGWRIRQYREQFRDKSLRYSSTITDRICEQGNFGQKTGSGYYTYEGRDASPSKEVESLILSVSEELGIERKPIANDEIVNRILLSMVNEGAHIVSEGYAARASDIDVTYIYGYGFPRYQGGPMYWAQKQGLDWVLDKVQSYKAQFKQYWEPAPLLIKAAELGSWDEAQKALQTK